MTEPIYRLIGAKIEHVRTTLGWKQEDLAKRMNLKRTSIANIEAGRQRLQLHTLEAFALAFNVQVKVFLKGIWI